MNKELWSVWRDLRRVKYDPSFLSQMKGELEDIDSFGFENYDIFVMDSFADDLYNDGYKDEAERIWDAIAEIRQTFSESKKFN